MQISQRHRGGASEAEVASPLVTRSPADPPGPEEKTPNKVIQLQVTPTEEEVEDDDNLLQTVTEPVEEAAPASSSGLARPLVARLKPGQAALQTAAVNVLRNIDLDHALTHLPKRADCDVCQAAKMVRYPHRKVDPAVRLMGLGYGDLLNLDYIEATGSNASGRGHQHLLVIKDVATKFLMAYPKKSREENDVRLAMLHFIGDTAIGNVYGDGAPEFEKAINGIGLVLDKSLPGRSQTNGIIERTNREVNAKTRAMLLQAGLPPPFWDLASQHACHAHNITADSDGVCP